MIDVVEINSSNFEREVLQTVDPVIVEFWTEGCKPCEKLGRAIRALLGQLKMATCNVDDNPDLAATYGVLNIPTVLFFKNGKVVDRAVGYMSDIGEEEVARKCTALLAA